MSLFGALVLWPVVLPGGAAAIASVETTISAFVGPSPGTTYVYHFSRNGVAVEGSERLVTGVARDNPSRLRLQQVERFAGDGSRVASEKTTQIVLGASDNTLELVGADGQSTVLLSAPLRVGHTWSRTTREWRPTTEQRYPPSTSVTESDLTNGTWKNLVRTCRVERVYRAQLFEDERIVVVVSSSVTASEGVTVTTTEEWATGLGMVRTVTGVKDESGRQLNEVEQRLVRVLSSS